MTACTWSTSFSHLKARKLLLVHCHRPSANDYVLQFFSLGFDRLMAVLCQATSLRDVIAFPKSYLGRELLTGAPSEVEPSELASYHIQILNSSSQ